MNDIERRNCECSGCHDTPCRDYDPITGRDDICTGIARPGALLCGYHLLPAPEVLPFDEATGPVPTQRERDIDALRDWWVALAHEEANKVVPKAVEYGSTDLYEIGRTLAFTQGKHDLDDQQIRELGIYFYVVGKMARWTDAILEGRNVSDDTLHDIGVYVRMAQRVRAVGGWPFDTRLNNEEST